MPPYGDNDGAADTVEDDKTVSPAAPEQLSPFGDSATQVVLGDSDQADTTAPAAGETVTSPLSDKPQDEGVQTGGLTYTQNSDGTRNYPEQGPVDTTDDPTPTPEVSNA